MNHIVKKKQPQIEEVIDPNQAPPDDSVAAIVLSYLQSTDDNSTWQQVKESYSHEELRLLINKSLKLHRQQN